MSKRTVLNENYQGLVESMSIPAEVHERDGKKFATFGSVRPIHCSTQEQVKEYVDKTHHYCDIFSEQTFNPLGELAYVRLDENTAEKVFINRSKRILIHSHDGQLALWRCAPTFESNNQYLAGTPIVNKDGALVSVVTAKRGNYYAISNFEGDGGYFSTTLPWKVLEAAEATCIYGDKNFSTRDELRDYVASLPEAVVEPNSPPTPVLVVSKQGASSRIALVASNDKQISHQYIHGVIATGVQYL